MPNLTQMAETRPSGVPIVPDDAGLALQEIAQIDGRGRIHLLPRWAKRATWLLSSITGEVTILMVMMEPGFLSLRSWQPDGPRIVQRYAEIAERPGADLEALRLIHDRYRRLPIPIDQRPHLGDAALLHLGLPTKRGLISNVYVAVSADRIDLLSPPYRDQKLIEGHPALYDLP